MQTVPVFDGGGIDDRGPLLDSGQGASLASKKQVEADVRAWHSISDLIQSVTQCDLISESGAMRSISDRVQGEQIRTLTIC